MSEQLKSLRKNFKEFWKKKSSGMRRLIAAAGIGIMVFSAGTAYYLNHQDEGWVVLYAGIDDSESAKIYSALREMEIPAQLNSQGQVMVEEMQADMLLLQLSGLGYPKSAPTYDVFSDHTGFTTTEYEKKQYLLFQLQDRIEKTLCNIDGIKSAIVTLDVPEESNYVWQTQEDQKSSASVLLAMKTGNTLSSDHIQAIKNLVASSVPKMTAQDVTLVDAATSLELKAKGGGEDGALLDFERLDFEAQVEKQLSEKVLHVLSIAYKPEDIRVSATAVIDYDKMITEQLDYVPDENGNGIIHKIVQSDVLRSQDYAEGIAGEENNTDVPVYVDTNGDGQPEYVDHNRNAEYLVSYIKSQIEKNKAQLKSASLAIVVNDPSLSPEKQESLIAVAAKATNVLPENISLLGFDVPKTEDAPVQESETAFQEFPAEKLLDQRLVRIGIGVVSLLFLLLLIVLLIIRNIKKKKLQIELAREAAEIAEVTGKFSAEQEMEDHKRRLREAAEIHQTKNAVTEEVREFAAANPEVTAALIRSWLKEDE